MRKFATEEDRLKAIEALNMDQEDYDTQFEEIQNGEIGVADEPKVPEEPKLETPKEDVLPKEEPPKTDDQVFTVKKSELPAGFSSVPEVFKSHQNKDELIQRQAAKIQELISKIQKPVEEPKREPVKEEAKPVFNSSALSEARTKAGEIQSELDAMLADDEDLIHSTEYKKKERELLKLNRQIIDSLTNQVETSYKANETYLSKKAQEAAEEAARSKAKQLYDDIDTLGVPEFKMSKSVAIINDEFIDYRKKVALAYYGRPAHNQAEEMYAYGQMEQKNPVLMQNLQLVGVSPELSPDFKNYLEICKVLDYRDGRVDPLTGKECNPLTEYDVKSGTHKPLALQKAVDAYRARTGYNSKLEERYQKGAMAAAAASMRRDQGAIELGNDTQSKSVQDEEWAYSLINSTTQTSLNRMLREAEAGKPEKLEEYNRAAKLIGCPELST